jgi:hypothetical protein
MNDKYPAQKRGVIEKYEDIFPGKNLKEGGASCLYV